MWVYMNIEKKTMSKCVKTTYHNNRNNSDNNTTWSLITVRWW